MGGGHHDHAPEPRGEMGLTPRVCTVRLVRRSGAAGGSPGRVAVFSSGSPGGGCSGIAADWGAASAGDVLSSANVGRDVCQNRGTVLRRVRGMSGEAYVASSTDASPQPASILLAPLPSAAGRTASPHSRSSCDSMPLPVLYPAPAGLIGVTRSRQTGL